MGMKNYVMYKDTSRSVEERVEDLLSRMTLEEKTAQLCGDLPMELVVEGKVDKEKLRKKYPYGHGRLTQYSALGAAGPEAIAQASNEIQRYFVEETRLGIPVALQSENLMGYPSAGGTVFPSMMNVASAWEPELTKEMARIIGKESRAVGINSAMSPVVDVSRDPRWGRTYETFGEDPYLVTQMGVNYIQGMQGENKEGPACIAKHFLGYAETQGGLNCAAARIGDRELYETFATPFEAAAKEADVSGMMANYGEIDGLNVCANPKIAKTLLRDTMGFQGMLTSDGAGIMRLWKDYKLTRTYAQAGLLAKKSGVDTEIPIGASFEKLPAYIRSGELDEAVLDESVRRILKIKFVYGLFEHPYVDVNRVQEQMENERSRALSKKISDKSIILLKNSGILPLKKRTKLAVIGPHANSLRYPVSGYTYPAYVELVENITKKRLSNFGGIGDILDAHKEKESDQTMVVSDSIEEKTELPFGVNEVLRSMGAVSLREELSSRFQVNYAEGCSIMGTETDGFDQAIQAAENSEAVILTLGGNCGWINATGGEGIDRSSLELPGVQQLLLEKVVKTGKPVILVLYGPGCFALPWAAEHADAILEAWMPGPAAGKSVADILDGTINPEGKLPVTIPRSVGQVPIYYNHKAGSGYYEASTETEMPRGGYVNESVLPLYPFGFGLSYTCFRISDFVVTEKEVPVDGTVTVSCKVTNTGEKAGSEVVQLYTHFMDAHVTRPVKSLSGFRKVYLEPGETKQVEFSLETRLLGYYNEDMRFVVEPGELEIMVGTSSTDLPCKTSVKLTGEAVDVMGHRAYETKTAVR